jgi:hypothetical protein
MTGSGDVGDDDVARPTLGAVAVEVVAVCGKMHGSAEVGDEFIRDPRWCRFGLVRKALFDRSKPSSGASANVAGKRAEPGQDGDESRELVIARREQKLEIVDLPGEEAIAVDELAVEELERSPDSAPCRGTHDPAFVAIINGIVATATMTSNTM